MMKKMIEKLKHTVRTKLLSLIGKKVEATDSVYVLKQPTHSLVSLIVINEDIDKALPEEVHKNLDKLSKISDVFFIFTDRFQNKMISLHKFSNLYGASGFVKGSSLIVGQPLFLMIDYCKHVFEKMFTHYIIREIGTLNTPVDIKKILKVQATGLSSPVLIIERLKSEELWEIYTNKDNKIRTNSTHRFTSNSVFLSQSNINVILEKYDADELKDYIDTFNEPTITYLIASLIKHLNLEYVNNDLEEISYVDSKRGKQ